VNTPGRTAASPVIQRSAIGSGSQPSGRTFVSQSGGSHLPDDLRHEAEGRFHANFANVRIHSDRDAGTAALSIGARAFATGQHIYFAPGQYQPRSAQGVGLIAHELTHVVQQQNGRVSPSATSSGIAAAKSVLESEAEAASRDFSSRFKRINVAGKAPGSMVQRDVGDSLQAMRAVVSGGIEAGADYVVSHLAVADSAIQRLNSFRKDLRARSRPVILDAVAVQRMQGLYNSLRSDAPSWLPAPSITFASDVQPALFIVAGVAIGLAELLLFLAFVLVMLWYLGNLNPAVRRSRERAVEDLIEKIKEAGRRTPASDPLPEDPEGKKQKEKETKPDPKQQQDPEQKPDEKPDPKPDPTGRRPPPPPPPGPPNVMRFQVQWNTGQGGPTFSQVATAPAATGVTAAQAVTALDATVASVKPGSARDAAQPAADKQEKWIRARPPAGIAVAGYSKSEYFEYRSYTDARVDVENLRGHNLKE
jgi:hypothetical protein